MRGRRAAAATLVLATLALASAGATTRPHPGSPPKRLPAGAGRAIAERGCLLCHSAMLITQQAKDSAGWSKTVLLMEKWGAPVTPTEHDTLLRWLVKTLGPRKRAAAGHGA
jgi:hypothetical protein